MSVEFSLFVASLFDRHTAKRIRRHAKKQGLRAQRSRSTRYKSLWFIVDATNNPVSDRNGLDNDGALAFLQQYAIDGTPVAPVPPIEIPLTNPPMSSIP